MQLHISAPMQHHTVVSQPTSEPQLAVSSVALTTEGDHTIVHHHNMHGHVAGVPDGQVLQIAVSTPSMLSQQFDSSPGQSHVVP